MTNAPDANGWRTIEARTWVVRKNGMFYRPLAQGYTNSILEAGMWTEAEAKALCVDREGVSACPASEFGVTLGSMPTKMLITDEMVEKIERERDEARAENTRLRAALAKSDQPCAYCSLPADEWAKCASGFPGCDRADDAMGCPELGAALRAEAAERERDALAARVKALEEALEPFVIFHSGHVLPLELAETMRAARAALTKEPTNADQ